MSLNYYMDKKNERLTFRTTKANMDYLKKLGDSDERSASWVVNKMIEYFKNKGIKDIRKIK